MDSRPSEPTRQRAERILARASLRDPKWGTPPARDWTDAAEQIYALADRLPASEPVVAAEKAQIADHLRRIYVRYFHGCLVDHGHADAKKIKDDLARGYSLESPEGIARARKRNAISKRAKQHADRMLASLDLARSRFGEPQPREQAFPKWDREYRKHLRDRIAAAIAHDGERSKAELAAAYAAGRLSPGATRFCVGAGVLTVDRSKPNPWLAATDHERQERERAEAELVAMIKAMPKRPRETQRNAKAKGRPQKRVADTEAARALRDAFTGWRENRVPGKRTGERRKSDGQFGKTLDHQVFEIFIATADPGRIDKTKRQEPYDDARTTRAHGNRQHHRDGVLAYHRDMPGRYFFAMIRGGTWE